MTRTPSFPVRHPLSVDPSRVERLVKIIDRDIDALTFDGVTLKVSIGDELVIDIQRGYADREAGTSVDATTVFASMSTGKNFLATLFLSYVERGLLNLTAPVAEVLPEFGQRGKGRVTPFHILTNTSGIMAQSPPLPVAEAVSNRAIFDYVCKERLEFQPGERINYSMVAGHAVLAEMLLEVDGRRRGLAQLMHEELFQPAGMTSTALGGRADLAARMAPIVARFKEPGAFHPERINAINMLYKTEGAEIPAAGYLTCSHDLHRFANMLRRGGEIDGFRFLSPAMLEWCTADHTGLTSNGLLAYAAETRNWTLYPNGTGIGFILRGDKPTHGPISTLASPRSFGGWGAGSTCFWVDPKRDVAFSLLMAGVMADDRHVEKASSFGDMVLAAMY